MCLGVSDRAKYWNFFHYESFNMPYSSISLKKSNFFKLDKKWILQFYLFFKNRLKFKLNFNMQNFYVFKNGIFSNCCKCNTFPRFFRISEKLKFFNTTSEILILSFSQKAHFRKRQKSTYTSPTKTRFQKRKKSVDSYIVPWYTWLNPIGNLTL